MSATRDAFQFSVSEAAKSVAIARERFRLLGKEAKIRHVPIESGHDYNQPMREAMYGWLEKWFRGRGDGGPIPEPEIKTEEIDGLRCFADGQSRPKTIVTIPEWAPVERGEARPGGLPKAPRPCGALARRGRADSHRAARSNPRRLSPKKTPARSGGRQTRERRVLSRHDRKRTNAFDHKAFSKGARQYGQGSRDTALLIPDWDGPR